MRVDANVSVRPAGSTAFGTRCEIKNLNSLRSLGRAIDYEAARQIAILESGGEIVQETRHWDESAGRTEAMRSKEEANDYRYFPEPDLVALAPEAERLLEDASPLVRGAAIWALARLAPQRLAVRAVHRQTDVPEVEDEWGAAVG